MASWRHLEAAGSAGFSPLHHNLFTGVQFRLGCAWPFSVKAAWTPRAGRNYQTMRKVSIIDSHTGGEPTRVVVAGGPDLGNGPLASRCKKFQREFDSFRAAVVNEPRGSDVIVGALLVAPVDESCVTGVIFFNNVGYLGMCGHGTIGLGTGKRQYPCDRHAHWADAI
jgi:hypothetical protein